MFLALEIMGFYLKLLLNLMALSPPISSIIELNLFLPACLHRTPGDLPLANKAF